MPNDNEINCSDCRVEMTRGDSYICEDCSDNLCENCFRYCNSCEIYCCRTCRHNCDEEDCEGQQIQIPFRIEKSKTFKINKFKNNCGVEIETINSDMEKNFFDFDKLKELGFSQMYDGSLETCGEFVSNAFNGDLLFNKIDRMCGELVNKNYDIDKKCGLHIHIKIPKTLTYLKKVVLFYQKYESYFFQMLPKSRLGNRYCLPFKHIYYFNENIKEIKDIHDFKKRIYGTSNIRSLKRMTKYKYHDKRYCWLNLHSLFYRGTLEIRNHNATIDKDKIKNLFSMHLEALDLLKKINLEMILNFPDDQKFFLSIFSPSIQEHIKERWKKFNRTLKPIITKMEQNLTPSI